MDNVANFNKMSSFNLRDNSYFTKDGRLYVEHNLPRRMSVCLNHLLRNPEKGLTADELAESVNARHKVKYTTYDMRTALNRLQRLNCVRKVVKNRITIWKPTKNGLELWKKTTKVWG